MRGSYHAHVNRQCVFALVLILTLCPAVRSADAPQGDASSQFVVLEERSELSALKKMFARFSERSKPSVEDYDLANERFKLIVPPNHDASKPAGLLVYITPGEDPQTMGQAWAEVMARHNLIFIAAVNSGNDRERWHRFGLALDAQHNVAKQYKIDRRRVYIAGMSGGGRCASRMGIVYADVFDGAMPMCGCDHFDHVPHPAHPGMQWRRKFSPPKREILNLGKTYNRYVFITGEKDGNRVQTLATATLYRQIGFAYTSYLEVPGMGHTFPPADWFEKGIEALDAPIQRKRRR